MSDTDSGGTERTGDAPEAGNPAPPVLALVRDLIFAGRICGVAEGLGVAVKVLRDPQRLRREAGQKLLVDLNLDGAIDAAAGWKQASGGMVIGFVQHTDAAAIQRARAAGLDRVMARSAFVEELAGLLMG